MRSKIVLQSKPFASLVRAVVLAATCLSSCASVFDPIEVEEEPPSEEEGVPRPLPPAPEDEPGSEATPGEVFQEGLPRLQALVLNCDPVGAIECSGRALRQCVSVSTGSEWVTLEVCKSALLCDDEQRECQPAQCEQGQLRCQGAGLETCGQGLDRWNSFDTCRSAAYCDHVVERGCRAIPCNAGEQRCNDGVLERCNSDATGWDTQAACESQGLCEQTLVDCEVAGNCVSGELVCAAPACEPQEVRCEGVEFQRCNDERTGFDVLTTCVSAALCAPGPIATGCQEPICAPAEHRCSSNGALEICNAEQTGYDLKAQCINAANCDAVGQACQQARCSAGQRRCNGQQIEVCRTDRTGFERAGDATCATQDLCFSNSATNDVRCLDPVCVPNEFRCEGNELGRCNAGLTGFDPVETCVTEELCNAVEQRCEQPVCRAGFHNCKGDTLRRCLPGRHDSEDIANCTGQDGCNAELGQCGDPCFVGVSRCRGAVVQRCDDPLNGWEDRASCATEALCEQGVVQGGNCGVAICAVGEHRCDGSLLQRCNDGRTAFDLVEECSVAGLCDAGARQCDVCEPGQFSCQGADLFQCSDDGQRDELSDTCPSAELCSVSAERCLQCTPPNSLSCETNGNLLRCSGDQLSVVQVDDCGEFELCRSTGAGCLACAEEGHKRCEGASLLQCVLGGTQETEINTCDSAALCVDADDGEATCEGAVCSAGQLLCNAQGAVVECNFDLTGTVPTGVVCGAPSLCFNGICRDPVCEEGASRCEGAQIMLCNEGRTGFTVGVTTCDSEALCEQNNGVAECRQPTCAAGAIECVGTGLVRCLEDRTGFETLDTCASPSLCAGTIGRDPTSTQCDECFENQCSEGQSFFCVLGQLQTAETCSFGCNGSDCAQCASANDCPVSAICVGSTTCNASTFVCEEGGVLEGEICELNGQSGICSDIGQCLVPAATPADAGL